MASGDVIRFGVYHDETNAFGGLRAIGGKSADLFGAAILLPQGGMPQAERHFGRTSLMGPC